MYEMPAPSLFVVRYRESVDLDPSRQEALVEAIRGASRLHTVALVFVISEEIGRVDFAVPSFWLKLLGDPTIRIGAMAMVTGSMAVEIAARSFGAASRFRRAPLEVRVFAEERPALAWARGMAVYAQGVHP